MSELFGNEESHTEVLKIVKDSAYKGVLTYLVHEVSSIKTKLDRETGGLGDRLEDLESALNEQKEQMDEKMASFTERLDRSDENNSGIEALKKEMATELGKHYVHKK